ncbi:Uncharacterised protein [Vibrio cholerae]|nr:Uncharacterised protein [Vibrio cholerae]
MKTIPPLKSLAKRRLCKKCFAQLVAYHALRFRY